MLMIEPPPRAAIRAPNTCVTWNVPSRFTSTIRRNVVDRQLVQLMAAARAVGRLVDAGVVDEHRRRRPVALDDGAARPPRSTRAA